MSSDLQPLRICVVSSDTKLLHEAAWMLTAVGYTVDTTKDFEPNALWRRYADFDVLIVDGRAVEEPAESILAHDSHNPVYRIFLYDAGSAPDFAAWEAAGANDAIGVPLSRGELLTLSHSGVLRVMDVEYGTLRNMYLYKYGNRGHVQPGTADQEGRREGIHNPFWVPSTYAPADPGLACISHACGF